MRRNFRFSALLETGSFALALSVSGCAVGSIREARVGGLGKYPEARSIVVQRDSAHSSALDSAAAAGAERFLASEQAADPGKGPSPHLTLHLAVTAAEAGHRSTAPVGEALSTARSFLGISGIGAKGGPGRLELEGRLKAPDGREVGYARWEHEGPPESLATAGGEAVASKVARLAEEHRSEYVARRASDERFLLTPSSQTLAPGEFVVSDDEIMMARLAVGLSRRLQLDFWTGGFPIPAAAGGTYAGGHAIISGGAAGLIILGFFDFGLKLRVLDESAKIPGVAIAYDLLDVFGLAAGGVGAVLIGGGVGGGGIGVVAGSNAQFNLVTLTAGKHFGPVQLSGGTYLLDNHHFLTQSAGFQSGCAAASAGPSGGNGGVVDCGSGSTRLPRLPLQVLPYLSGEWVFGPHVSILTEGLLQHDLASSMFTTGTRFLLGWEHSHGPLALDRIRMRLDLAALWRYREAQGGAHPKGAAILPLPWIGLGLYVF